MKNRYEFLREGVFNDLDGEMMAFLAAELGVKKAYTFIAQVLFNWGSKE